jgi:phosphoglycerate dehydrogenase-like enzyme
MIYRYARPEMLEGLEKTDFAAHSGNLVLWGAGKLGSVVAHKLQFLGIEFLAFVDIDPEKQGGTFCGHKIISPDELRLRHSMQYNYGAL